MSFFQERAFLKKFLAGDTGFWYAKTPGNEYKTPGNEYKTPGNAYKTPGNA